MNPNQFNLRPAEQVNMVLNLFVAKLLNPNQFNLRPNIKCIIGSMVYVCHPAVPGSNPKYSIYAIFSRKRSCMAHIWKSVFAVITYLHIVVPLSSSTYPVIA